MTNIRDDKGRRMIKGCIDTSVDVLLSASNYSTLRALATLFVFYIAFNYLEAGIETLIFGNSFYHWFDPLIKIMFIAYGLLVVYKNSRYSSE